MWVEHPLIKPQRIEAREYQLNIARSCLSGNTLVVLGTGLGKTVIATIVIAEVLYRRGGKALFLAPTKPLVEQHRKTLEEFLNVDGIVSFTGEVKRDKRAKLWKEARVIISTPQVIENDIAVGIAKIEDVNIAVFDEAHRAVGNYSYVFIAEHLKKDTLIMGITASPGGGEERIKEVIENLRIENVEIRTEDDPDVRKYINPIKIKLVRVRMPEELGEIYEEIKSLYEEIVGKVREEFKIFITKKRVTRSDLLRAQEEVQKAIADGKDAYYTALSLITAAIKIDYAIENLEIQGFEAFLNYLEKIVDEGNRRSGTKAAKMLIEHPKFISVYAKAKEYEKKFREKNPKLLVLKDLLDEFFEKNPEGRAIVFAQYRETARIIVDHLNKNPKIRAVRFVGQASRNGDRGLRQKEQIELIEKFRKGEFNVLVATSVAEEGLDIPQVDVVIFYEAVPSEIRTIQRRGRTGRRRMGTVYILTTEKTRDVAYFFSSKAKERKMKRQIEKLREMLKKSKKVKVGVSPAVTLERKIEKKKGQLSLTDFFNDSPSFRIIADSREFGSEVIRNLIREGVAVESKNLDAGDYVISDRVIVERKSAGDFVKSIVDGRLFQQVRAMKETYDVCVIIVEGDLTSVNFNQNAVMGALASLLVDFKVPVIFTKNPKETAELIKSMARREKSRGREVAVNRRKKGTTMQERQRAVVEALPNISATLAKRLLTELGSVKNVINADVSSLMSVRGIGRKTAEEIYEVVNSDYRGDEE